MPLRRGKKREVSRRGKGRGGEAREERRIEEKRRKKRREEKRTHLLMSLDPGLYLCLREANEPGKVSIYHFCLCKKKQFYPSTDPC